MLLSVRGRCMSVRVGAVWWWVGRVGRRLRFSLVEPLSLHMPCLVGNNAICWHTMPQMPQSVLGCRR